MRCLAVGDIHGNYDALMDVLEKCNYDPNNDMLIAMGDYTDRGPKNIAVVEFLLSIGHFIGLLGNHDVWVREYLNGNYSGIDWILNGGKVTYDEYEKAKKLGSFDIGLHKEFFNSLHEYYVLELNGKKYGFVHGGFYSWDGLGHDDTVKYTWCRELWEDVFNGRNESVKNQLSHYDTLFIGHCPTNLYGVKPDKLPVKYANVINLDQGIAYENGRLTICDIETEQCWQSSKK